MEARAGGSDGALRDGYPGSTRRLTPTKRWRKASNQLMPGTAWSGAIASLRHGGGVVPECVAEGFLGFVYPVMRVGDVDA